MAVGMALFLISCLFGQLLLLLLEKIGKKEELEPECHVLLWLLNFKII
jgi:hypothetical protein